MMDFALIWLPLEPVRTSRASIMRKLRKSIVSGSSLFEDERNIFTHQLLFFFTVSYRFSVWRHNRAVSSLAVKRRNF
ncbi:hypothetical protein KCP76_12735 [Salmonella enterica subsp. enterica serovar Weltevreden]|nr:hypothetical protein KCP76_12735 [Salmonella enterica subsp. enterica serovar Weltevreden]